jgi:hypothetical protein
MKPIVILLVVVSIQSMHILSEQSVEFMTHIVPHEATWTVVVALISNVELLCHNI